MEIRRTWGRLTVVIMFTVLIECGKFHLRKGDVSVVYVELFYTNPNNTVERVNEVFHTIQEVDNILGFELSM